MALLIFVSLVESIWLLKWPMQVWMSKVNIDLETVHQANAFVDKVKTLTINITWTSTHCTFWRKTSPHTVKKKYCLLKIRLTKVIIRLRINLSPNQPHGEAGCLLSNPRKNHFTVYIAKQDCQRCQFLSVS